MKMGLIFQVWRADFCKIAIFDANSDAIPPTSITSDNVQKDISLSENELMVVIYPMAYMSEK